MENKQMTEQESLALITDMINKTKQSFHETGFGPIMWGALVATCAFITFIENKTGTKFFFEQWNLVWIAIIPQVWYSIKQGKKIGAKSYNDIAMDYTWIAFGVSMGLLSVIISGIQKDLAANFPNYMDLRGDFRLSAHYTGFHLMVYGIPTFITGGVMKFKPMIFGGIACWVFAIISTFTYYDWDMLLTAAAAIVAWLVPGLILNHKYRKLKKANV